jgi:hypothetical protein
VFRAATPTGVWLIVPEDLTANTSEYLYTDSRTGLEYLYCNGAAVSQTTYADLYAYWGASKWAADSGGNFSLPDSRGRELLLCGTHADCDLGDTIGPATESSRRGSKHGHAITSLSITGAPTAGTLGTSTTGAHTHAVPTADASGGTAKAAPGAATGAATQNTDSQGDHSHTITGAPGVGTLDVGGTIGTDTNEGGAAIVIGSLLVRTGR